MGDDEGGRNLGSCGRGIQRPYWSEQAYGPYIEALIITIRFPNVPSYKFAVIYPRTLFQKTKAPLLQLSAFVRFGLRL